MNKPQSKRNDQNYEEPQVWSEAEELHANNPRMWMSQPVNTNAPTPLTYSQLAVLTTEKNYLGDRFKDLQGSLVSFGERVEMVIEDANELLKQGYKYLACQLSYGDFILILQRDVMEV